MYIENRVDDRARSMFRNGSVNEITHMDNTEKQPSKDQHTCNWPGIMLDRPLATSRTFLKVLLVSRRLV